MSAIAIVGIGCRFGGADDTQGYWKQALEGRHAFTPVPPDRWPTEAFLSDNRRLADKSYAPTGAFIDDIYSFPALELGIPPRRVEVMDPQQRFTLEAAMAAVEDAGLAPEDLPHATGVFVGVTSTEFRELQSARTLAQLMALGKLGDAPEDAAGLDTLAAAVARVIPPRPYSAPGALGNMNAAMVAQELDLHGPAYTTDSACASALVAVADAIFQLRTGAVDAALAGGVYLSMTPDHHVAFSRIGAISGSGVCRPFDARADGFVQGDGVGLLLLKRLEDAERDGDRIYAVIRGLGLNSDGSGDGPMAPNLVGQSAVIRRAWEDAGVDARNLGYIETHGTGTPVGDPVEFQGLVTSLGDAVEHAYLGSSKANVGHTMSAAGVAGVIRAALALHHRTVPPLANFETPHEKLPFEDSPFEVPRAPVPWDGPDRLAAVSSFGFGGTNVHVVLGAGAVAPAEDGAQQELVLLSAGDMDLLEDLAARTAEAIELDPAASVAGVARAFARRRRLPARLGIVASTLEELTSKLRAVAAGDRPEGTHVGLAPAEPPKVAFLFPGQGAQRPGMLRDIRARFSVVAQALDDMERALDGTLAQPLSELLYPPPEVSDEEARERLRQTSNTQPALLAVGVALDRLLQQLGVRPAMVTGHSLGEFTAAAVAGVVDPGAAARFVALRGQAMERWADDPGTMAALGCDRERAASFLVDGAVLANMNHPSQVVVSGFTDAVAEVARRAEAEGVEVKRLEVSHGFHSPALAGLDVDALVDEVDFSGFPEAQAQVISAIDGAPYRDAAHARDVWRRHALSPVDFMAALEACEEAGADVYLQVGAGGPLASFARGTLRGRGKPAFSLTGMRDDDGGAQLLDSLARLWTLGVEMDVRAIAAPATVANVPPSALPKERYWVVKDGAARAPKLVAPSGEVASYTAKARPAAPSRDEAPGAHGASASRATGEGLSNVAAKVTEIIAQVSAYPAAAVKPSLTLMGALGFDSLMVADLAKGLSEAFAHIDGIPQELLVNSPTVGDVIEWVERSAQEVDDGEAAEAASEDLSLATWRPVWRDAAPRELPGGGEPGRWETALVVRQDERAAELADALAARLADTGVAVTTATEAEAAQAPPAALVVFVTADEAPRPLGAVLAGEVPWPDPAGALIATLDRQAALGTKPDVLVVRRADDPWAEAASAVARSASREWPSAAVKSVTFEGSLPADARAAHALEELGSTDRTVDVRFVARETGSPSDQPQATRRQVLDFEPAGAAPTRWSPGAGDTVVVTGGTRGLGLKIAARLADTGAKVVLVGRGAPSAQAAALMAGSDGRVVAARADVTDRAALEAALAPHRPITALVHAAGLLADGALGTVDPEQGAAARAVKVRGWLEAIAASGDGLQVAFGVGSWAGQFGNAHQAHYAAGNALMAALVGANPNGVRMVVGEFSPWSDSEMARTIPEVMRRAMRAEGVDFLGDDEGLAAVWEDLTAGEGVVLHARRRPLVGAARGAMTLSLDSHPYLADHALPGEGGPTPVLPLAAATDLCAWAAGARVPFQVSHLRVFRGVTVTEPVSLELRARGDKAELRHGDGALAYRARVRPLGPEEVAQAEVAAPPLSRGGAAPKTDLDTFYREITFHGPLLRGVVAVDGVGEGFVRGRIRTGRPQGWEPGSQRAAWVVDPLAFDGAMQMAALVAWERYHRAGMPLALGRWAQLRPLPVGGEVWADVHFGEGTEDRFEATIAFYEVAEGGTPGALLALAEGVVAELREVDAGPQEAASDETAPEAATSAAEGDDAPPSFDPKWADPAQWKEVKGMALRLKMAEAIGLRNPYFHVHEGTARDTTVVEGRELLNFSSYNYIGLSGDPRVVADVKEAVERFGTSVSASRVASGERPFHGALERELAACQGAEEALIFTAGHAANVSTIGHVFTERDIIFHDELIHDSILGGVKMSGAARRGFKHDDPQDLERQLKELRGHYEKALIVIEGVYSMDGDIADVPAFIELKRRYGCLLMIDEAHSFGIIGATGQGVREHFGLRGDEVDIWMGTLSKSLASCGGWIAGSRTLMQFLRYTVGGFVFSAGMTPANTQAALSSLRLMKEEPWRVEKLQHNAAFFHAECAKRGLDTGPARGGSGVVPVITGNSIHALWLSQYLIDEGINVQPIVFPAVADDAARLRFFLSSTHSEEQLAHTAERVAVTLERVRAEKKVKGSKGI